MYLNFKNSYIIATKTKLELMKMPRKKKRATTKLNPVLKAFKKSVKLPFKFKRWW